MQLNELRKDLEFNAELLSLVETLKNVAGAQYHVLEKQKERFDARKEVSDGGYGGINFSWTASLLIDLLK